MALTDRIVTDPRRLAAGALAGAIAAGVWVAAEPITRRALRVEYSDVRMLGRTVTAGRAWPIAGVAVHLANGAGFGAGFAALGLRGVKDGLAAAGVEHVAAYPLMIGIDALHPDGVRRGGRWPRLLTDPRTFLQQTIVHAVFGVVLGSLTSRFARHA